MAGTELGSASGKVELDIAAAMRSGDELITQFQAIDRAAGNVGTTGGKGLETLDQKAQRLNGQYGVLGKTMLGVGGGIIAGFAGGIFMATGFESAMSNVAASMGGIGTAAGITTDEFEALNEEALRIGAETAFSASEAAAAMDVLAKAGVSATDILGGTAQASVDLAAAIGEDVPASAEGIAAAMAIFGPGVEQPLTDSAAAADTFTAAINASQTDLTDFNAGLRNFGPAAAALGLSFEDVAGSIAYFTQFGLKGADVGVSLNAAMTNLAKPTGEAQVLMDQLGISAFDATGQFVGMPAVMDQVAAATGNMSDEQRELTLRTIFGAEAADVMTLAAQNGGDGLREMTGEMAPAGQAATQAATRLDNLAGDVEGLKGTLETLGIVIGSTITPALRVVTQGATSFLNAIVGLPAPLRNVIVGLTGVAGVALAAGGGALLAYPKFLELQSSMQKAAAAGGPLGKAIRGVGLAFRFLQANIIPLLIIVALVTLAVMAFKGNWLGFGDLVRSVAGAIGDALDKVVGTLKYLADSFAFFRSTGANPLQAAFLALSDTLRTLGLDRLADLFALAGKAAGKLGDRLSASFKKIGKAVSRITDAFGEDGLMGGIKEIFGQGGRQLLAGFGDALSAFPKMIGEFLTGFKTGFAPIDRIINQVGRAFIDFGRLVQEVFQGDFKGALEVGERLVKRLFDIFIGAHKLALDGIVALFKAIPWGAVWDGLVTAAGLALDGLRALAGMAIDGLIALFQAIPWSRIWEGIQDVTGTIIGLLGDLAGALLGWAIDAVEAIPWADLWEGVVNVTSTIVQKLGNLGSALLGWVIAAVVGINWGDLWGLIVDVTGTIVGKLGDLALALLNWAGNAAAGIPWDDIWGAAVDVTGIILARLGDLALALLGWVGNAAAGIAWSDVWGSVVDITGVIIGKLGDLTLAIGGWVASAIDAVTWDSVFNVAIDAFGLIGDAIAAVTSVAGLLSPAIQDVSNRIRNGVTSIGDVVTPYLQPIIDAFQWLYDWADDAALAVSKAAAGIKSGLDTLAGVADAVLGPIVTALDGIRRAYDALPNFLKPGGGDDDGGAAAGGSVKDIRGGPDMSGLQHATFGSDAADKASAALDTFAKRATAAASTATPAFDKIAAAAGQMATKSVTAFGAMTSQVQARMAAMASGLTSVSQQTFQAFAQTVQQQTSRALSAFSSAAGQIQSRAASLGSQVAAAGRAAFDGFAGAAQSGMSRAVGAAQSGANQIVGALRGIGSMYSFGAYIGSTLTSGIADAIRAGTAGIASAAANAVNSAMNAARSAAGNPSSPSPVMWDKVGWPLAQALFMPFEAADRSIRSAAGGAVNSALTAAQAAANWSPLSYGGLGSYGTPNQMAMAVAGAGTTIVYDNSHQTIEVSGVGDPDAVADRVMTRLRTAQRKAKKL